MPRKRKYASYEEMCLHKNHRHRQARASMVGPMVHAKNPPKPQSKNTLSSTPVSLLSQNQLSDASGNISLPLSLLSEDVPKTSELASPSKTLRLVIHIYFI